MEPAWIDEFLVELQTFKGYGARSGAEAVIEIARGLNLQVKKQKPLASKGSSLAIIVPEVTNWDATICVGHAKDGTIGWEVLRLRKYNPFIAAANESRLKQQLLSIPGYTEHRRDYPAVPWASLTGDALETFRSTTTWAVGLIRRTNIGG